MGSIFDLGATFRKSLEQEYTAAQVCRVLELEGLYEGEHTLHFIQNVRRNCARLSLLTENMRELDHPEKFRYLQFVCYICRETLACRREGWPLFRGLEHPSNAFQRQYQKMLGEIGQMASKEVRRACADSPGSGEPLSRLLRRLGRLGQRLYLDCSETPPGQETDADRLNRALDWYLEQNRAEKASAPKAPLRTSWDRLYLLLSYYVHFGREEELLRACRMLPAALAEERELLEQNPDLGFPAPELAGADKCLLIFEDGEVRECAAGRRAEWTVRSTLPKGYTNAMKAYISDNRSELAGEVFGKAEATCGEGLRILWRVQLLRRFWTVECQQCGRIRPLRKGELIAAYQVMLFSLPYCKVDIPGKRTLQKWKAVVRYRTARAAAFYEDAPLRQPYCLQLVRLWTEVRYLCLVLPPDEADRRVELYLSTRRKLLEAVLTGGRATPLNILRARTEAVLRLAEETLDGDGRKSGR